MGEIKHSKITDLEVSRKCDHEGYEYYRRQVGAGELLFFPAGAAGAHKLTNCSDTENLVYIDFDVIHDLDVAVYPDSGKIGVWGMGINKVFRQSDDVDYYEGE